jgi:hypothetical protein
VALLILSPKAAKSVAAALVQVTNTISNPAITQSVPTTAQQMILLKTPYNTWINPNNELTLVQVLPDGTFVTTPYVVPAGQKLVVTQVDIAPFAQNGAWIVLRVLWPGGYSSPVENFYLPNTATQDFRLTPGMVFPAGTSVAVDSNVPAFPLPMTGIADVSVLGYLTVN